jgi:hypothetical protein
MNVKPCPICASERSVAFSATVLAKYQSDYLKCGQCGFLGAHDPVWLDEAYESAIADVDTGVLARARDLEPRLICILRPLWKDSAVFADIGAGYGVLVRAMRDAGLDFRWSDPHCANLLARGFELGRERCQAITAIEVLEHAVDPITFLGDALHRTGASAAVLTTELLPEPVPDPASWWYYAFETGQHVSFFERRTLELLATKLRFRLRTRGNLHVLHTGQVKGWRFLLGATRLAPLGAALLGRSLESLTGRDNPLLEATLKDG